MEEESKYECDECGWEGDDPIFDDDRTPTCPECGSDTLFEL